MKMPMEDAKPVAFILKVDKFIKLIKLAVMQYIEIDVYLHKNKKIIQIYEDIKYIKYTCISHTQVLKFRRYKLFLTDFLTEF